MGLGRGLGLGLGVKILHASGWGTSYYHTSDLMVSQGEQVQMGQPIGRYAGDKKTAICDNNGRSAAPHLHIGLFKVVDGVIVPKTLDGACINDTQSTRVL